MLCQTQRGTLILTTAIPKMTQGDLSTIESSVRPPLIKLNNSILVAAHLKEHTEVRHLSLAKF